MSLFLPVIPYFSFIQFEVGPLRLYVWGLAVGLGFAVGIIVSAFLANRAKFNVDHILNLAILIFIGGFAGARLFYILFNFDEFQGNWAEMFRIYNGGMVFFGGFAGALLLTAIYVRIKKLNFWQLADIFTPGLALGMAIGRLGCLAIHDHIGRITKLPFGMEYFGEARFEPSMFESIWLLLVFFFLLWRRQQTKYSGQLFIIFLLVYAAGRFMFDFFRSSDLPFSDPRYFGLTVSQFLTIIIAWAAIYFLKKKKVPKSDERK